MAVEPKAIPDAEVLAKAAQVEIWDKEGKKVSFGSVFEGQKTVVVFIRAFLPQILFDSLLTQLCIHLYVGDGWIGHFFCGVGSFSLRDAYAP